MAVIPKKIVERFTKNIVKYQRVLKTAKDQDVNETDTVAIINDIFSDVFGYDKYTEITSELSIRGTFCDLAVKIDDKFAYLIECKAIGLDLKDNHLRQAVNYGVNKGIQWIILTNGHLWNLYYIRFEKPVTHDLVVSIDLLNMKPKDKKTIEDLYLFSKEGLNRSVREDYYDKVKSVNRFIVGNLLLSEPVVNIVRKELRKLAEGVKIEPNEILDIIQRGVLKRDIFDGEEAKEAQSRLKKFFKKNTRKKVKTKTKTISQKSSEPVMQDVE